MRDRLLRYGSFALSATGTALIILWVVTRGTPISPVADLAESPAKGEIVCIAGEVVRNMWFFDRGDILFYVNDGTGEMRVLVGRETARKLAQTRRLPRAKDRIELTGPLHANAAGEQRMMLLAVENLKRIDRPARSSVSLLELSEVSAGLKGREVVVEGAVKKISLPKPGTRRPYIFTLAAGDIEVPVVFWESVLLGLNGELPAPGTPLRVRARVDVYHDMLELKLDNPEDLIVLE